MKKYLHKMLKLYPEMMKLKYKYQELKQKVKRKDFYPRIEHFSFAGKDDEA